MCSCKKIKYRERWRRWNTGLCQSHSCAHSLLQIFPLCPEVSPLAKAGCSLCTERALTIPILGPTREDSKALAELGRHNLNGLCRTHLKQSSVTGRVSTYSIKSLLWDEVKVRYSQTKQPNLVQAPAPMASQMSEVPGTLLCDRWGNWDPERSLHSQPLPLPGICNPDAVPVLPKWAVGVGCQAQNGYGDLHGAFSAAS